MADQRPQILIPLVGAAQPSAPWLSAGLESIESLSSCGENWDSNHAAAVKPDAILGAQRLLTQLASSAEIAHPLIYPTRSGGVQLEWQQGARYLEVEVASANAAKWYECDEDEGVENEGLLIDFESLSQLMTRIPKAHD